MTTVMNNRSIFSAGSATEARAHARTKGSAFVIVLLILVVFCPPALAANFQVQPMKLSLSASEKSGALTVINNGDDSINFQISAKEWAQDEIGKDIYTDTRDIVFFPKIMTAGPHEQRAIRIGFKAPRSANEKTYRIFVEEIPSSVKKEDTQTKDKIRAGISISFRFAIPVFVKPLRPQASAVIQKVELFRNTARATITNTGNVHVKVLNVTFRGKTADGKELFTKDVSGWYILRGLSIPYEAAVPMETCSELETIEVNAKTENFTINGFLDVQKDMCAK